MATTNNYLETKDDHYHHERQQQQQQQQQRQTVVHTSASAAAATDSCCCFMEEHMIRLAQEHKTHGNYWVSTREWTKALQSYRAGLKALTTTTNSTCAISDDNDDDKSKIITATNNNNNNNNNNNTVTQENENGGTEDDNNNENREVLISSGEKITAEKSSSLSSKAQKCEVALRSNAALALLKLNRPGEAEKECTAALALDPQNAKAWYRRAQAKESQLKNKNIYDRNNNTSNSFKTEEWKRVEYDLMQCIQLLNEEQCGSSQHNGVNNKNASNSSSNNNSINNKNNNSSGSSSSNQKKEAQLALDRVRATIENSQRGCMRDTTENTRPPIPTVTATLAKMTASSSPTPAVSVPPDGDADANVLLLPPYQQRQDIVRLLMGRQKNLREQQQHRIRSDGSGNSSNSNNLIMLMEGEAFYLINMAWWSAWCRHVNFFYEGGDRRQKQQLLSLLPPGACFPKNVHWRGERGQKENDDDDDDDDDDTDILPVFHHQPIDNSSLIVTGDDTYGAKSGSGVTLQLKPNLIRGYHYELLPREVYNALRTWYGEAPPHLDSLRAVQFPNKRVGLMLYPQVHQQQPQQQVSIGHLCSACHSQGARARCSKCSVAYYCNRSCQESHWNYHEGWCKKYVAAARNADNRNNRNKNGSKESSIAKHKLPTPVIDETYFGRVGLNNLGNTCFMNAAIQCLSHVSPLTKHFLTNKFKKDLNVKNPLGTGGKLAFAYETVVKDLWMGTQDVNSFSPLSLKRAIAMFAPRFAGCSQHDAQEFLAYLLDGLHEDLNRIRKAPYVKMSDVKGGTHSYLRIAGAEAWEAHQRRNDSLVVNTFHGQFKSTCVCPQCDCSSVSFDTFNHVSLEIPQQKAPRTIAVIVFPQATITNGTTTSVPPTRYAVTLPRSSSVVDLKRELSGLCRIPVTRMGLCDIYQGMIYSILPDSKPVSSIAKGDVLAAYDIDPDTNTVIHVIGTHALIESSTNGEENDDIVATNFGYPFMTSFRYDLACRDIWDHLWNQVQQFVSRTDEDKLEDSYPSRAELRSMLQIRVLDHQGNPQPVFRTTWQVELDATETSNFSLLPKDSDETLLKFLGEGCAQRFCFFRLEWTEPTSIASRGPIVGQDRFIYTENDDSLIAAINEQRAENLAKGVVTLDDCFKTFTRPERLDDHNKWYCSKCKEHVRALKTMELWRLPSILVVHLKRFEFKNTYRRDKLETFVNCPLDGLDMSKYCSGLKVSEYKDEISIVNDSIPAVYDLFAVINHHGRMGFGHYTAYARRWDEHSISDDWALFDDSSVRSVGKGTGQGSGEGVVTPAAYVLFYRRRAPSCQS